MAMNLSGELSRVEHPLTFAQRNTFGMFQLVGFKGSRFHYYIATLLDMFSFVPVDISKGKQVSGFFGIWPPEKGQGGCRGSVCFCRTPTKGVVL